MVNKLANNQLKACQYLFLAKLSRMVQHRKITIQKEN